MRSVQTVRGGGREGRIFATALQLAQVETTPGFTMLAGRAAPYGEWANRLWFMETFDAGLFDKSIKEAAASLPLLIFHDDLTWPIGSSSEWKSEADGLHGVWRLDGSIEAQRAAQLAADGHLPYLSVGYQPVLSRWEMAEDETWDPADVSTLDKVHRVEARLVETSVLSTPAFATAEITLVRSAESTRRPRRTTPYRPGLAEWQAWRSTIS